MEENYIWPEITEETTLEEVREIHKKIWDYVIEHGEKPETPYDNDCVLCEYAIKHAVLSQCLVSLKCAFCPAIWSGSICIANLSEYGKWIDSLPEEKKYWAKRVRDIPFEKT